MSNKRLALYVGCIATISQATCSLELQVLKNTGPPAAVLRLLGLPFPPPIQQDVKSDAIFKIIILRYRSCASQTATSSHGSLLDLQTSMLILKLQKLHLLHLAIPP